MMCKRKHKRHVESQQRCCTWKLKPLHLTLAYPNHFSIQQQPPSLIPLSWGRLHESNGAIVFYQKPCLSPTHLSLDPS